MKRGICWLVVVSVSSGWLKFGLGFNGRSGREECLHEWQVVASLVPKRQAENVEETLAKSIGENGEMFKDDAEMRLRWVLRRRDVIDLRATSQAKGKGVWPQVSVNSFFWDVSCSWCENFAPKRSQDGVGWEIVLNIRDSAIYAPVMVSTKSFRKEICQNDVLLRLPLIELLSLTNERPFIMLGYEQVENTVEESSDGLYSINGTWTRLSSFSMHGVSWFRSVVVLDAENAGYLLTLISSNDFLGPTPFSGLNLGTIFPFQNLRENIGYDWHVDAFNDDIYVEKPAEDSYISQAIDDGLSWHLGPCFPHTWEPFLISFGSIMLSATSWGLAVRSSTANFQDSSLNEAWSALAPICGRVITGTQRDLIDHASSCSFLFVPDSENHTVPFRNDTFDVSLFEDLQLPTAFFIEGIGNPCKKPDASKELVDQFQVVEIRDSLNRSLVDFLGNTDGKILAGLTSIVGRFGRFIFLLDSYALVTLEKHGIWQVRTELPKFFTPAEGSAGERLLPLRENVTGTASLILTGITKTTSLSAQFYIWGNTLLFTGDEGHTFWKVAQASNDLCTFNVFDHSSLNLSFVSDNVQEVAISNNDWIAVLTKNFRIWVGRTSGDRVFLQELDARRTHDLEPPLNIFFNEADELFVLGVEARNKHHRLKGLSSASRISLDCLETIGLDLMKEETSLSLSSSCMLDDIKLFAAHSPIVTRTPLKDENQDSSSRFFQNVLPKQIFLDKEQSYDFDVVIYSGLERLGNSFNGEFHSRILQDIHLGFELSNQDTISLSVTREDDLLQGIVKYHVSLQDLGRWTRSLSSNASSFESNVHGLAGVQPWITTFKVRGLSKMCMYNLVPGELVTSKKANFPATINIYSGCPPMQEIRFDAVASRGSDDHGCKEDQEDICLFYPASFSPKFVITDHVTGHKEIVDGDYGNLLVVGGGQTHDEIQDYQPFEWEEKTRASIAVASTRNFAINWFCLLKSSPCSNAKKNFPYPPSFFLKLRLAGTQSNGTYCDFSTEFVVRLHNLPISLETILVTNLVTIAALLLPILYVFYRRQRKILQNLVRVHDVDIKHFTKSNSDSDSFFSDEFDSEDEDFY